MLDTPMRGERVKKFCSDSFLRAKTRQYLACPQHVAE